MKKLVIILAILTSSLIAQNKQSPDSIPPQSAVQSLSAQQLKTIVKPVAKSIQPHSPQQLITFTAEQLDEYEDKIIDRTEEFYNRQMSALFMIMGIIVTVAIAVVGIIIPLIINVFMQWQRKISFEKELVKQSRKFEKALASDSGIHFLEHAKNLPYTDDNAIEKLCLFLYAVFNFAKSEETDAIHDCFKAIDELQLPKYSMGRDINEDHNYMLSRYDTAYTAIKEHGFEEKFKTQLKSVETKIESWHDNLPENKKSE